MASKKLPPEMSRLYGSRLESVIKVLCLALNVQCLLPAIEILLCYATLHFVVKSFIALEFILRVKKLLYHLLVSH